MSQNSENSKRVMRKTKMNKMNILVNPLTHFPPKIKAFPLSFLMEREWV